MLYSYSSAKMEKHNPKPTPIKTKAKAKYCESYINPHHNTEAPYVFNANEHMKFHRTHQHTSKSSQKTQAVHFCYKVDSRNCLFD